MAKRSPFRYFNSSPEVIRLVVMMYVTFPLSLRNVEDLLRARYRHLPRDGAALVEPLRPDVRGRDPQEAPSIKAAPDAHWRWHLDEMYVKINGEMHYLWRAVDHEGEVLESPLPARAAIRQQR